MKMEPRSIALDKIFKRRGRYDIPDWQRDEVWPLERKQLLIDSILNNWKLPKFYFAKTSSDPDEFDVVDGQQRLSAIWEFFEGKLPLSDEAAQKFGGYKYSELPFTVTDIFDDFEIQYDEITEATDDDIQKFFQRLQGGMMLTSAEKLNSAPSGLTKFARELSEHAFFQTKVATRDSRKAYFDIAFKALALETEGFEIRLRYEDLRKLADAHAGFSEKSGVAVRLMATLDYLNVVFSEKNTFLRNRSTIQSIITLASRIVATGRSEGTEETLLVFIDKFGTELARQNELGTHATDTSLLEYQRTLSANLRNGAQTRHNILLRKLLVSDPIWAELLSTQAITSGGISEDIDRLGRRVNSLVTSKNDEYSARNGIDLVKPTSKTVAALTELRDPVRDFNGFSKLIGDLYFIFHEGVGNRLEGKTPSSFEDIRMLRTGMQHDVDHGRARDVTKKRLKIGAAFSKYATGAAAPAALTPDRFPIIQAALLQAIVDDLESLEF